MYRYIGFIWPQEDLQKTETSQKFSGQMEKAGLQLACQCPGMRIYQESDSRHLKTCKWSLSQRAQIDFERDSLPHDLREISVHSWRYTHQRRETVNRQWHSQY